MRLVAAYHNCDHLVELTNRRDVPPSHRFANAMFGHNLGSARRLIRVRKFK
jgi:hypothetical protein